MTTTRVLLVGILVAVSLACGGGGSSTPPACEPACRSGFTCLRGVCVEACNPACSGGQVCLTGASGPVCTFPPDGGDPDGGGTQDSGMDGAPTDTGGVPPMDTGGMPPTDTGGVPPADTGGMPPVDTGTPPADTGTPPTDAPARPPCGRDGQPCCLMSACVTGLQCAMGRCGAYVRETGECNRPMDCPMGQICSNLDRCSMGTRNCFRCNLPGTGRGVLGATCMGGADCETGFCAGGTCSVPCAFGTTGDMDCAGLRAGFFCSYAPYQVRTDGGMNPVVSLGFCRQRCARHGDCATGQLCLPTLNDLSDEMNFRCGVTSRMGATGSACDPTAANMCQTSLCVPTTGTMGYCTAPCATNADCPVGLVCGDLPLIRPSGGIQTGRMCVRM
ncbi:MAG: hypothetical protein HY909_18625 [Deltaproteobacteria bacterium]|nr:hypothetical protein [Deltaproteobacteria bacterium]